MKKQPTTLRKAMIRAFLNAVIVTCCLAGSFLFVSAFGNDMTMQAPQTGTVAPEPTGPSKADRLMERHGCWSGEAPADMQGVIPGGAVVTEAGRTRFVKSDAAVGNALDHVFGNPTEIESVHGFCR